MTKILASYGCWPSPITGNQLNGGNCMNILELKVSPKGTPFWIEQTFPHGNKVLFERNHDGQTVQWSPSEISISNSVHEYGGGSFCLGQDGRVFICVSGVGGVSEVSGPHSEHRPIFQNGPNEDIRHADLFAHGDFIYAVQEVHVEDKIPVNQLVRLHIGTGESQLLTSGADFYSCPRVSPDGRLLAWIQWNNPYMPWEKTSVYLMELSQEGFSLGKPKNLLENGMSNFGLTWFQDEQRGLLLYLISDSVMEMWNVHELDWSTGKLDGGLVSQKKLSQMGEIGEPLWQFANDRPFSRISPTKQTILAAIGDGLFEVASAKADPLPVQSVRKLGFTSFAQLTPALDVRKLFLLASGPTRMGSLIEMDLSGPDYPVTVLRETRSHEQLMQFPISQPELLTFQSGQQTIKAYFYPPLSHSHTAPAGDLPPVVFFVHPGPTSRITNSLSLKKQYFTTRGFAVFEINYRGSTGEGKTFRDQLLGQWGVVDRDDMIEGAKFLVSSRRVDPKRICILGSSAGGFTALSVLYHPMNVFSAAVSIYGVTDLIDLLKSSHKFERDNTTRLIAPYPEGMDIYEERSPLYNTDRINTPVAFLHGVKDMVVPAGQADLCYERLKGRGIQTTLKMFPDEGHGFRKAETIAQTMDISLKFMCRVLGITHDDDGDE